MSNWDDEPNDSGQLMQEDAGGGMQNDGFNDHEEEAVNEAEHDPVDVVSKKKSGPNPKVIAVILGVVMIGVVGIVGTTMYNKFKPRPKAAPMEMVQAQPMPEVVAPAAMPMEAASEVAVAQPAVVAMPVAAPSQASELAAPAMAAQDPMKEASVQAQPDAVVQPVQANVMQKQISVAATEGNDVLAKRVDAMAVRLDQIEQAISRLANNRSDSAVKNVSSNGSQQNQQVKQKKSRKEKTLAKESSVVAKEEVIAGKEQAPVEPDPVTKLKLRGVYPPQGENRQAWIMDPASGSITTVSQGSQINGATVLSVDSDRVVTNRGIIR